MASKIIANLIVLGSGILIRAFTQAYSKALQNAAKSGVAQETANNFRRAASKAMTLDEARKVLGVAEETPWQEVLQRYKRLYDNNERVGSFYLQSKVERAKECIEAAHPEAKASAEASASNSSGPQQQ